MSQISVKIFTLYNLCFICLVISLSARSMPLTDEVTVVTEYLEPYQVQNEDGSVGGMATEIMQAVFTKLNMPFKVKVMP